MQQDKTMVPGREHYSLQYLRGGRVFSYAHQINSVLEFEPRSVLEIGTGTGMVAAALQAVGIQVLTADVQPELEPDLLASVTDLPLADNSVDVALCCQVLEHLPFEQFELAVGELKRVSSQAIVISLPDASPHYEFILRLPKRIRAEWIGTRQKDPGPAWRKWKWDGSGHYWEIGYKESPLSLVHRMLCNIAGEDVPTWRVRDNKYHRFFILKKREISHE